MHFDEILIECSPGISGDMLLAGFYDLGVPKSVIEQPLHKLGLREYYQLSFCESKSCSLRGIKTKINVLEDSKSRDWRYIRNFIFKSNLEDKLKGNIISVFESLANSEANVHGIKVDDVHFHEIGSLDSIIDVVGICAAIDFLSPIKIYSNLPMLGRGSILTEHGEIPLPSPAVIDLISKKNIPVLSTSNLIEGELATPTGIALLSHFVDTFEMPAKYAINSYGIGLGSRKFNFPNLLRISKINSDTLHNSLLGDIPRYEEISIQEAFLDDQSSEEVSSFVEILREEGAYEVSYQIVNMKKNRLGFSIMVLLPTEKEKYFRDLWFQYSNTIGLRVRRQGRWVLPRRRGRYTTSFGEINCKETIKLNGEKYTKPENDDILNLQKKYKKSAYEIKKEINESKGEFNPFEDWQ